MRSAEGAGGCPPLDSRSLRGLRPPAWAGAPGTPAAAQAGGCCCGPWRNGELQQEGSGDCNCDAPPDRGSPRRRAPVDGRGCVFTCVAGASKGCLAPLPGISFLQGPAPAGASFAAQVSYYRAMCVMHPFNPAPARHRRLSRRVSPQLKTHRQTSATRASPRRALAHMHVRLRRLASPGVHAPGRSLSEPVPRSCRTGITVDHLTYLSHVHLRRVLHLLHHELLRQE